MKRLFIAFELPDAAKSAALAVQEDVRRYVRSHFVSWIPEDRWHITSHFLGHVDDTHEDHIRNMIASLPKSHLLLTCWSVTGFPTGFSPRNIVLRFADPTSNIFSLRDRCSTSLGEIGLRFDTRPWIPHLTLGRSRQSANAFREDLAMIHVPETPFLIPRITLFESTIGNGPPVYTRISTKHFY
jgi:RNA 2',3'-cyclic 3'-phosphodiesterase